MNFDDTKAAFQNRTTSELERARRMFRGFVGPRLVRESQTIFCRFALWIHLPVKAAIRKFGFDHFYGGESLEETAGTMTRLSGDRIRSILDYSVEGIQVERELDATRDEVKRVIDLAANNPNSPFAVFKVTGLAREALLEKASALLRGKSVPEAASISTLALSDLEQAELERARVRMHLLCSAARESKIRILIDAEHSWFQPAIDWLALQMMQEFNQSQAVVYNTLQMYRVKRLDYLKELHFFARQTRFAPGIKLVRGAYMELERARAKKTGAPVSILPTKAATDAAFDAAVAFCVDHIDDLALLAGTHNESSLKRLVELLNEKGVAPSDARVEISQLLGMRDNASVLLATNGYNVSKYVPYGPLRKAFPYLARRAQENTSIQGQVGRELELIEKELARRKGG